MLIIRLTETKETLQDIETICRHLVEHNALTPLMTVDNSLDISYILKPTLKADHCEAEKMAHWQKLLNEFVLKDKRGHELLFIRDENTQGLYFGNKEGFNAIEDINHHHALIKTH